MLETQRLASLTTDSFSVKLKGCCADVVYRNIKRDVMN